MTDAIVELTKTKGWDGQLPRHDIEALVDAAAALGARVAELEGFRGDVMAGCDIQKGKRLYRQVRVVIGPGKTQAELDIEALRERVEMWLTIAESNQDDADAAEARVAELAAALEQIIPVLDRTSITGEIRRAHDKVERLVKAALTASPADAMERARAKDAVVTALSKRTSAPIYGPSAIQGSASFLVRIYFESESDAKHCGGAISDLDGLDRPAAEEAGT